MKYNKLFFIFYIYHGFHFGYDITGVSFRLFRSETFFLLSIKLRPSATAVQEESLGGNHMINEI